MGRVTWGGGISASDIDNADRNEFKPYDGPIPPNGVYAFKIKILRRTKSNQGNDQLHVGLELVPRSSRPDDKKFKDFYISDFIPLMESTARRVAAFTDAIGVTGADLMQRTNDDGSDQKNILKIGKVTPVGKFVLVNIQDGEYKGQPRKEVAFGGYYPPPNAAAVEPDADDAGDGADADDAPPF